MKIGVVGFGNRVAQIFFELKKLNKEANMVAYVDPFPIGKPFAEKNNFFPSKEYSSLSHMLRKEKLDLLMIGSPNHLHLEHIRVALQYKVKIFVEKPIVINEEQTWELVKLINEFGEERIIVGLVLRYSQHVATVKKLIENKILGKIISIEASEHLKPWHGGFFMRNWRRKTAYSGGFMLEKCCHDLDLYNSFVGFRPSFVSSFGSRTSFTQENLPTGSLKEFTKYNLKGWESINEVFDSDADIVDHQVAIVEYENGATLSFHTNLRVPDEFRRFVIIGTKGMVEGDFVRGYLKAHDSEGNIIYNENYDISPKNNIKGHYGADNLMLNQINKYLIEQKPKDLPVGVKECIEAGLLAMKIEEARTQNKVVDITQTWDKLDSLYGL